MTSGWRNEAPKIVLIETRYVETDAINFREVVQSLTGKNSSTAWIGNGGSSNIVLAGSSDIKEGVSEHDGVSAKPKEGATSESEYGKQNSVISSMVLLKNMSFKDFDEYLLSDLPPFEELLWL